MSLLFLLLPLALLGLLVTDKDDSDDDLPPDHEGEGDNNGGSDGPVQNGTTLNDLMDGGAGNDRMAGLTGDDIMMGAQGNDSLGGGAGDDLLMGEAGNDSLSGDHGDDVLLGGAGNDILSGGDGEDLLLGGAGADLLAGGAGDDMLAGGTGPDTLHGGAGNDVLVGVEMTKAQLDEDPLLDFDDPDLVDALGRDFVARYGARLDAAANSANKSLAPDELYGNEGSDTLIGDAGDSLTGGAGLDAFINHLAGDNPGLITVTDYARGEAIMLQIEGAATGAISVANVQNGAMVRLDGQDVVLLQNTAAAQVRLSDITLERLDA